jgi:hypothetical protein
VQLQIYNAWNMEGALTKALWLCIVGGGAGLCGIVRLLLVGGVCCICWLAVILGGLLPIIWLLPVGRLPIGLLVATCHGRGRRRV